MAARRRPTAGARGRDGRVDLDRRRRAHRGTRTAVVRDGVRPPARRRGRRVLGAFMSGLGLVSAAFGLFRGLTDHDGRPAAVKTTTTTSTATTVPASTSTTTPATSTSVTTVSTTSTSLVDTREEPL